MKLNKPGHLRRGLVAAAGAVVLAGGASAVMLPAHATSTVTVNRVAGPTRYQTSAMIAETKYPSGVPSGNVLLATGLNFPDALAGNYLAGQLGAPILLTPPTSSDPNFPTVTSALSKLLPGPVKKVTILGGTAAVGSDVQSALTAQGYLVSRIGGATRYDTAQMIDTQSGQTPGNGVSGNPTAILATGQNYPDALSAGPLAWDKKFPVVLTDGTQSTLSPQAQATLSTDKIKNVLIMGGSAAMNPGINAQLTSMGITIDKQFAGVDRTDTAAQLASYAQSTYGFGNTSIILASGLTFADALSSGPWGGGAPMNIYLTATSDSLGTYTTDAIQALAGTLSTINIAGGTAAVDANAASAAQAAAETSTTNATYSVSPTAAQTVNTSAASHGSAQFSVTNAGTSPVDVALFNCTNAQSSGGTWTFTGSNPGGSGNVAVPGTVANETITVVNGTSQTSPATQVNGVTPSGGALSFTVTNNGTPGECVTPVVFAQTSSNDLTLGANNQPTVPFGVGAQTTFTSPAAAGSFGGGGGSTAPTDTVSSYTTSSFTTVNGTYAYGPGDTYQIWESNGVASSCTSSTFSAFQSALSLGDKVGGNYQPGATSTFCLNDIAPAGPSNVTATQNTSSGGVTIAFVDSPTTDVTSYNVYRATSSDNGITGAPSMCPTLPAPTGSGSTSPQTPPSTSSSWAKIGSVPDTSIGSGTGGNVYSFNDPTAAPASGTAPLYCYAVSAVGPSAGGTEESTGVPANTNATASSTGGGQTSGSQGIAPAPAPASAGAPVFSSASVQGLTVTATYNQAINPATVNTKDFTVSYGSANNGTGTQNNDAVTSASGSGTTVTIELTNPVPTGQYALITATTGSTGTTVCANGGTTSCQPVGNSVITSAATAAGTAPVMMDYSNSYAKSSTSAPPQGQIVLEFGTAASGGSPLAIDCATVDSSDWSVTTSSGVPIPISSASCSNSSGTAAPSGTSTSDWVVLTPSVALPSGSLTVKAQVGSDGNTVIAPSTGSAEPTGDSITLTAS